MMLSKVWSAIRRVLLALIILLLIAPFAFLAWFFANRWSHDDLILSKETTYITEPLDELGYPNYAAALNERMSQGVTPENNAAVLVMKAVGPKDIPTEQREAFFQSARDRGIARDGQLPDRRNGFCRKTIASGVAGRQKRR